MSTKHHKQISEKIIVDMQNFDNGVYFVELFKDGAAKVVKVIKE